MENLKAQFTLESNMHIVVRNAEGKITHDEWKKNQVQDSGLYAVAENLEASADTYTYPTHMAVGTGTGQGVSTNALATQKATRVAVTGNEGTATNAAIVFEGVFAGTTYADTLSEAGLFNASTSGYMYLYNGSLGVTLGSSDTLTITWTLTASR